MTWLDYAVVGVFVASLAVGGWRGLVREVLSILGWVIAFLAELRVAAAYVAIFAASLVLTSLLGLLISKIVKAAGLGGTDRALGALFGAARGLLIVLAAVLLAGLTSAPRQPFWRDSASGSFLVQTAKALKPLLPQTFAERLRYD